MLATPTAVAWAWFHRRLSVCFFAYDIWKETDAASMIKLDVEMFHDEFFKAI